ncbi:hypothetical protein A2118_00725 [Candidatus Kaiserbacteria bacterium GWA2_50_9]|uniref:Uncharacterized protein n=1 Tax=Candidatus Kaiserbacteria bacterium GWA2_50_9 TaxID=1798474 RepID=A0A1F6BSI8_9BACT|nr:MAG: hypothetical protein A2118_00725 [Candidatus Kaiserbacteria bacterium GWA2_50_9]
MALKQRKTIRSIARVGIKEDVGAVFGYVAAAIMVVAFVWYGHDIWTGSARTNPLSWWMWAIETFVGLMIYADRTRDISKWVAEAASLVGVVVVALYLAVIAIQGHVSVVFASIESIDFVSTGAAIVTFGFWIATRKKLGAGPSIWVFQVTLILVAFPLIRATLADPSVEPFWPWTLWTISFGFQTVCAWLRWDGYEPVVNPLNYAIIHCLVAVIVLLGTAS